MSQARQSVRVRSKGKDAPVRAVHSNPTRAALRAALRADAQQGGVWELPRRAQRQKPAKRANRCGGCQLSGLSARAAEMHKVWQGSTHGIAMSPSGNGSYAARPFTPSSAVPGDNTNMSSRSPKVRPAVYHLSTHITTDQDTSLLQSTPTSKYFVTSPTYSHSEQLRRSINLKPIPLSQLVGVTQAELFRHCRLTTTSDSRIT